MKKFFYTLASLAVIALLFLIGLLAIASVDIPGVSLEARTVLTASMEPTIPTGSVVFIYPQDSYHEGDVVTFKRRNSSLETPITHRIVAVGTDESGATVFTTKGDGNAYEDASALYEEEIRGKVLFHIPFVGKLLALVRNPWGLVVLIIIPAALVILDEIKKVLRYIRERRVKVEENQSEVSKNN